MQRSKKFLLLIIPVALGIGALTWFMRDGYTAKIWLRRITHPSLEYRGYNSAGGDITDQEMTESAKAVKLVEQRPEVAEWQKQFFGPKGTSPATGVVGWVQTEYRLGDVYAVHVYEEPGLYIKFPTKTFGWYEVDRKTWVVRGVGH
ncbi:hypothetical protein HY629_03075 [Candidatus Uhrbacteria bacterium]|nr:hypothetical protein [Candidatus Uhrbacteria bacterium]